MCELVTNPECWERWRGRKGDASRTLRLHPGRTLVHGYFDIDFDRVWNTVRDDLPELAERLEAFLARQTGGGGRGWRGASP